ncbi:MAG: LnmK family bifunctional acyltransferase/decarboxylase [Terriglobales bacterium]
MPVQTNTLELLCEVMREVCGDTPASLPLQASLTECGLSSLALVVLRERCEKAFGVFIPDSDWLSATTVSDLVNLIDRRKAASAPPGNSAHRSAGEAAAMGNADDMAEAFEIGMPLMGIANLNESALLKHLGDLRWRHITRLTGVQSRDLVDAEGNRLYPAFFYVEIRFPDDRPLGSFGENDGLHAIDRVRRFGHSILDGLTYLIPPHRQEVISGPLGGFDDAVAAGIPAVRMANAFVMKFDGAEWLKRSRPQSGVLESVLEIQSPPASYLFSKQVQEGGRIGEPPPQATELNPSAAAYHYDIQPDRDVNGAGLLYFANYPLFLDLAERQGLRSAGVPWEDALINTRSLVHRKLVYLNNASWKDAIEIRTRIWTDGEPHRKAGVFRLFSEQRMSRKSDGRPMCVGWSEKIGARP